MPRRLPTLCLLAAATSLAAQTALPPSTAEVRCAFDRVVTLESRGRLAALRAFDPLGHPLRTIDLADSLPGARAVEVEDFAPGPGGAIVASLAVAYPLGASARLVVEFGPADERRVFPLDHIACHRIAQLSDGAIWCLGPGPSGNLLHRIDSAADTARSLLDSRSLPLLPNPGSDPRETWESGAAGRPQLLAAGRALIAWLPNAGSVVELDPAAARPRIIPVPVSTQTRSLISIAESGGALFALLPQPAQAPESLETHYLLSRFDTPSGRWLPLESAGSWPRGTLLAGSAGGQIVTWSRTGNLLQWRKVPRLTR